MNTDNSDIMFKLHLECTNLSSYQLNQDWYYPKCDDNVCSNFFPFPEQNNFRSCCP